MGEMTIYVSSEGSGFNSRFSSFYSGGRMYHNASYNSETATQATSVELAASNNNMKGTFTLYGIKTS